MLLEQANSYAQVHALSEEQMAEAKERCKAMEHAIDDQLIESRYVIQCREVIEDGCRLGTGILKGSADQPEACARVAQEPLGHWAADDAPDPMPKRKRVDPWHFFPDMSARTIEEAEFTYERHLPTKKDCAGWR
jgi:hypothetical protein